jgi:hypothetical protein
MTNNEIRDCLDHNEIIYRTIVAPINFINALNNALNNPMTIQKLDITTSINDDAIMNLLSNSNNIKNIIKIKNFTNSDYMYPNNSYDSYDYYDNTFHIKYLGCNNYYIYYDKNSDFIEIKSCLKNDINIT